MYKNTRHLLPVTACILIASGACAAIKDQSTTSSSPGNITSSPANPTSSPANITSSPANPTSSPANNTSSPANPTSSPANITSSPANITSSPASTTSSPANTTSSPASTTSSPANTTSSPATTTSSPPAGTRSAPAANSATVQVEFAPGSFDLPRPVFDKWIANAQKAVTTYYGHFPVANLLIKIRPTRGDQIGFATADYEGKTAVIELPIGTHITGAALEKDWVLTHEMTHLAFPLMDDEHRWVAEGMATYIEPLARLQIKTLAPDKVWRDMIDNLDQGEPTPGDRGLNKTHTWGRTYWGGALFCLLADIQLRKETHNKFGLQDAVRAILDAGGNVASDWTVDEAFAAGDIATGTRVLESLYAQMKDKPVNVDLDNIWNELGVEEVGDRVVFYDNASFASIRQAIEKGNQAI